MLFRSFLLLAAVLLTSCAKPVVEAAREWGVVGEEPLVVMSYNIRVGLGIGGRSGDDPTANLLAIANLIKDEQADLVLLQEVDRGTARTLQVDQPAFLAEHTGYNVAFAPAIPLQGGDYGIALLTPHPIEELDAFPLFQPDYSESHPDAPGWYAEQRLAQVALVATPAGPVTVINTHLGITEDQRARQVEQLADLVQAAPGPVILGGDLNAEPDAEELRPLRALLHDAYHDVSVSNHGFVSDLPIIDRMTFPADVPNRCIDYIFFSPGAFRPAATRVLDRSALSDHRPVVSVLQRLQ